MQFLKHIYIFAHKHSLGVNNMISTMFPVRLVVGGNCGILELSRGLCICAGNLLFSLYDRLQWMRVITVDILQTQLRSVCRLSKFIYSAANSTALHLVGRTNKILVQFVEFVIKCKKRRKAFFSSPYNPQNINQNHIVFLYFILLLKGDAQHVGQLGKMGRKGQKQRLWISLLVSPCHTLNVTLSLCLAEDLPPHH